LEPDVSIGHSVKSFMVSPASLVQQAGANKVSTVNPAGTVLHLFQPAPH
jgi:hypothetical protein